MTPLDQSGFSFLEDQIWERRKNKQTNSSLAAEFQLDYNKKPDLELPCLTHEHREGKVRIRVSLYTEAGRTRR